MTNSLRPYQQEDVYKLSSLDSCALFNEQRTGKTPTTLMLAREKGAKRIVILTTVSSQYQWKTEFEKWMEQPCLICAGTKIRKERIVEEWTDGLVISLDSFKETKVSSGLVNHILKKKPDMIILDEAHKIKNPQSANARAIFKTRHIPYKVALTGTPAPNKPYDVFSILSFLFPEKYPSFWKFLDEYFIIKDEFVYVKGVKKAFKTYEEFKSPDHQRRLQDILATFSTNRKRKDVMSWIEPTFKEQVKLPCTQQQAKLLKLLEDTYEAEHIITQGNLDRLIRYRQICLDPKLLDFKADSPKTDYLLQYLEDHPEEQIIVFSKFTSYLNNLIEIIPPGIKTAMITGDVPGTKRGVYTEAFQKGKIRLLLLNIDCCKESLTLDAADTTIFMDKYPPIGDIEQAEARFVATNKANAVKPRKIIELMMSGTYDERIYKLLELRKSETDIINDYAERRQKHGKPHLQV